MSPVGSLELGGCRTGSAIREREGVREWKGDAGCKRGVVVRLPWADGCPPAFLQSLKNIIVHTNRKSTPSNFSLLAAVVKNGVHFSPQQSKAKIDRSRNLLYSPVVLPFYSCKNTGALAQTWAFLALFFCPPPPPPGGGMVLATSRKIQGKKL